MAPRDVLSALRRARGGSCEMRVAASKRERGANATVGAAPPSLRVTWAWCSACAIWVGRDPRRQYGAGVTTRSPVTAEHGPLLPSTLQTRASPDHMEGNGLS